MKSLQDSTRNHLLVDLKTTPEQVAHWASQLLHLHARLAPRFARPEPHRRLLAYLQGILSDLPRKNGWQLAEHAHEATPYGMQRLLSDAVWEVDGVRDDLRTFVLETLGQHNAILVLDETSFPKRGTHSAGVQKQYCGSSGQVENCQVGVFLSYVTTRGHALIDRELYLPQSWTQDRERCRAVGVPDTRSFQTKCELAQQMLQRIRQAHLPIAWIVGDTVYGGNPDLRLWLETSQDWYGLAVACDEPVGIRTPDGQRRLLPVCEVEQTFPLQWQRLSMSQGTKGPRLFDWAIVPLLHHWQEDGQHWLLIRRCLEEPDQQTFYLIFAPQGTTLQSMVQAIEARWSIEEDFENTKDMGLDHSEVRSWLGWFRHMTLVMLAYAFLVAMCVQQEAQQEHPQLALTTPEVRHLLGLLLWPAPRAVSFLLAWSWWRRCHHWQASIAHTKRRLQAG